MKYQLPTKTFEEQVLQLDVEIYRECPDLLNCLTLTSYKPNDISPRKMEVGRMNIPCVVYTTGNMISH